MQGKFTPNLEAEAQAFQAMAAFYLWYVKEKIAEPVYATRYSMSEEKKAYVMAYLKLDPEDIDGYDMVVENEIKLPIDDQQMQDLGLRVLASQLMSPEDVLSKYFHDASPEMTLDKLNIYKATVGNETTNQLAILLGYKKAGQDYLFKQAQQNQQALEEAMAIFADLQGKGRHVQPTGVPALDEQIFGGGMPRTPGVNGVPTLPPAQPGPESMGAALGMAGQSTESLAGTQPMGATDRGGRPVGY